MNIVSGTELFKACHILFGSEVDVNVDFLYYIQPSGIKSAYRKKARQTHPDMVTHLGDEARKNNESQFIETNWAYNRLLSFVKMRDGAPKPYTYATNRPRPKRRPMRRERQEPRKPRGSYYSGSLPMRSLLLGQFLFYSGEIPWEALIKAIVWQRNQRPRLGDIAKKWGWLTEEELQRVSNRRKLAEPLGEALVRLNLLTTAQLNVLLRAQRAMQKPFGEFFIINSYLTKARLGRLLKEFKNHNSRQHRNPRQWASTP